MVFLKDKIRLQKAIAQSGYCSRRKAELLIEAARVTVNGELVTKQGFTVDEDDEILIDGLPLKTKEDFVYYLLNKPKGVITSAKDTHDRMTVLDLIDEKRRIYPVGRLDKESTGLLILTNDGDFAHKLMHPRFDKEKRYRVSLAGKLSSEIVHKLEKGIKIDGIAYQGIHIDSIHFDPQKKRSQCSVTLFEGKNRQIRRLFAYFDLPVLKLHRYAIGSLEDKNLRIGEYRRLKQSEINALLAKDHNS